MSRGCGEPVPYSKAVPGVRVAYTDEREIQHALDAGALVVVVPTVDTVEEAIEARNWAYFPPLGRRSNGGGQAFDAGMWGTGARRLPRHGE
jgi:2-keto-3-deoxy-L-rhamnonate aldolase RhmA